MGFYCFVPKCNSGYRYKSNNKAKGISMFKAPSDSKVLAMWDSAIAGTGTAKRPIKSSDHVCEKHFKVDEVVKHWEITDIHGAVVMNGKAQARLVPGAVPSIFPGNPEFDKPRKRKKLRKPTSCLVIKPKRIKTEKISLPNSPEPEATDDNVELDPCPDQLEEMQIPVLSQECEDSDTSAVSLHLDADSSPDQPGESNFENLCSAVLPLNWDLKVTSFDGTTMISYYYATVASAYKPLQIQKQLCFYYSENEGSVTAKAFIWNREIMGDIIGMNELQQPIPALCDVEKYIANLDNAKICFGGPKYAAFKHINPEAAYVDSDTDSWRHTKCQLVIAEVTGQKRCKRCCVLFDVFRHIEKRQKALLKVNHEFKIRRKRRRKSQNMIN